MNPLKSFFYSGKDFQPVYAWITFFCLGALIMLTLKLAGCEHITTGDLLGVLAFIQVWVLLYNRNKNGKG